MRKNILAQKGVVFGLDARLVLAILAIVSLGISLTKETQVKKDFERTTRVKMEFIESKFLQEWERLRFLGFGDNAVADNPDFGVELNTINPSALAFHRLNISVSTTEGSVLVNYVNPYNDYKMREIDTIYKLANYDGISNANHVIFSNFIDGQSHSYSERDFYIRYLKIISKYIEEEGRARFSVKYDNDLTNGIANENLLMIEKDGFGEPIRIYTVLDIYKTKGRKEYIANIVLFSKGGNKVLDSKLPKTLEDLKNFKVEGDDMFRIFSTKDIYIKAKSENLNRLKTIANKIESMAESAYATKISDCSLASSVTTVCDKNSDGAFDWKDKNILKNYNPYLKTRNDISGANYISSSNYYMRFTTNSAKTDAENFVKNGLGLPKYLAYDLFGNILKYDSNVNKTAEGPYTMEVWY